MNGDLKGYINVMVVVCYFFVFCFFVWCALCVCMRDAREE